MQPQHSWTGSSASGRAGELGLIIESVPDYAIFTIDADGRIASWNPGATRMFGWTETEAVGQHTSILFTPEDRLRGKPEEEMRAAREHGRAAGERWHLTKDGRRFYASGVLAPLRPAGEVIGFAKIARDLSDRKFFEDALRRAHELLERRVVARTAELAEANAALQAEIGERRAAEQQIKRLFKRLVSMQEEERSRIAREIHDHLGQQMTALRVSLETLLSRAPGDPWLLERLKRSQELAGELDQSIDFLTWQLRPAALDHLGLKEALQNLVTAWSEQFGISAECHVSADSDLGLSRDAQANLYRLAQEALHNVAKHSQATHVAVILERHDSQALLIVEDNGQGFDASAALRDGESGHLGLISMRERATLLDGSLEIESSPGAGTSIFVRVPVTSDRH